MAQEMGLDRAPIEFWKLVFLVPPINAVSCGYAHKPQRTCAYEKNRMPTSNGNGNGQMHWTGGEDAVEPDWKQMLSALSLRLPEGAGLKDCLKSAQIDQRREGQWTESVAAPSKENNKTFDGQWQWTGGGVAVEPDWKQMWGSAPSGERRSEKRLL